MVGNDGVHLQPGDAEHLRGDRDGGDTVTVSTLAQFYHPTTDAVYLAPATYGQLSVQGGVL